jgi:signal transduction histidine kinase
LLLVFLLSSIVAANLIRPISSLKSGAAAIGEGNFDYRIQLRTGDEIEELGHSLNKMAISLKELQELREIRLKAQYLAQSLKKEKELSQLKNQFITVASHQLNTPLSVMNWTLSAMRDPSVTAEIMREGLNTLDQSRRDILAMVNDLLTLSEIGFRYQKTKSEILDVRKIIEEVIADYRSAADAHKLKLVFESKIPDTKADASAWAIRKVVENLLDNAITYSNDGGEIAMELYGDEKKLGFRIADQGIGIPEVDKPSIFKEFFRAKNATMKKNVGTGLGLFIAKSIIDGHGGTIGFESVENKGATFFFEIPRMARGTSEKSNEAEKAA